MRQIVAVLGITVVLAGVASSGAAADPSMLKLRIDSQAQLVSPTVVLLPVMYDCRADDETAELGASVSQPERDGFAGVFILVEVVCTGKWERIVLFLHSPGPGFELELGPALASASLFQRPGSQGSERKVRLVA